MLLNDTVSKGQTESGSVVLERIEWIEHVLQRLLIHAMSFITDNDPHLTIHILYTQVDMPLIGRFKGILNRFLTTCSMRFLSRV